MSLRGLCPVPVTIETDLTNGLHSFGIVGLPDKSVEEARDRISAAIKNSGFKSPKQKNQKVVISLAPADVPKEGASFDLPMALGYLMACEDIEAENVGESIFLGELALDGSLRPVKGILPVAIQCHKLGYKKLFVPVKNAAEGAIINDIEVYGANNLLEIIEHIKSGGQKISRALSETGSDGTDRFTDMSHIRGHKGAKRALEIAAAGGHNIMLYGPPGTGKTMLAKAFAGIVPDLNKEYSMEVTSIQSINGKHITSPILRPPFRSPHHTASYASIVGGGTVPRPGEITLSHRGVLFMDEFPEFDRAVIEALREPMEERSITISRVRGSIIFPADCIIIAAMNLCPCGNRGREGRKCTCHEKAVRNYYAGISGPIADRIDLWVEVTNVPYGELLRDKNSEEHTLSVRQRTTRAREVTQKRFGKIYKNSEISPEIIRSINITQEATNTLEKASRSLALSNRSCHRVLKVARTIADLGKKENIEPDAILEALQYRPQGLFI